MMNIDDSLVGLGRLLFHEKRADAQHNQYASRDWINYDKRICCAINVQNPFKCAADAKGCNGCVPKI